MNLSEQKAIWQAVERRAQIKGWDFSEIAGKWDDGDDLLPWDFAALVQQYRRDDLHLLDMDTGGGEFLLSLGHPYERTAAQRDGRRILRFAGNVCCRSELTSAKCAIRKQCPLPMRPSIWC